MKNILYTIILSFLFSFSVFGEWTKMNENEDGSIFFDYDSVERDNSRAYIWYLVDLKVKDERNVLSFTALYEFDCDIPKRSRVISMNTYSGNMLTGELIDQDSMKTAWSYPQPNHLLTEIINIICKP
tara:strand:+ start:146 stop:526 length:381 start_codon:yes stop_codon:yes gene_type:complete